MFAFFRIQKYCKKNTMAKHSSLESKNCYLHTNVDKYYCYFIV